MPGLDDLTPLKQSRISSYAEKAKSFRSGTYLTGIAVRELLIDAICAKDESLIKRLASHCYPKAVWRSDYDVAHVATLRQCAISNLGSYKEIIPPTFVDIEGQGANGQAVAYQTGGSILASLPGARWIPGWDFIIASDGTVVRDSGYLDIEAENLALPHVFGAESQCVAYWRPKRQIEIDEDVIFVSSPTGFNFGHWLVDFLPRLIARDHIGKGHKIAVPRSIAPKQIETLRAFGFDDGDIIYGDPGTELRFRKLHVYKTGGYQRPAIQHIQFLRDNLSKHAKSPKPGRRFYLSRTSVGTRAVANDIEFGQLLTDGGFETVDPADISFEQQQKLFADAEVLLGAFGSNLYALYLAPPSCKVICMAYFDASGNFSLTAPAALFGQRYLELTGAKAEGSSKIQKKDADFIVDCPELNRLIRS